MAWRPFLRDMQQHLADLDARWGLGAAEAQSTLAEQPPAEAEQVWSACLLSDMQGLWLGHELNMVATLLPCSSALLAHSLIVEQWPLPAG